MQTILRIFSYLGKYPKLATAQLVCAILMTLMLLVFPMMTGRIKREVMEKGGFVHVESGIGAEVRRGLARRGHVLQQKVGVYGGYQAIRRDPATGVYAGASESRKDGQASGY
mgnify:CR=1 FL=1